MTDMPKREFVLSPDSLTDAALDARFGLRVPRLYAEFLRWIYKHQPRHRIGVQLLFGWLTGLNNHSDPNERYSSTPREMSVIGYTGGDGEHIGFVTFNTPFDGEDYPYVLYKPGEGAIDYLAPDTRTLLRLLLSLAITENDWEEPHETEQRRAMAQACSDALGLAASPDFAADRYSYGVPKESQKNVFTPAVPAGWRYVPRRQSVGVLAPVEAFDPTFDSHALKGKQDAKKLIDVAKLQLGAGFAGSALVLLHYSPPGWDHRTDRSLRDYKKLHEQWNALARQAYLDLGRPLIAARIASDPMW